MAQSDEELMKLVLEAEDRLTPELTKLQQRVQSLTWDFVNLSDTTKIDFRELTWADRELALLHNRIIDDTNALEGLTKWTDEYNVTLHSLMKNVDEYTSKKQVLEDLATQEVQQTLLRQQALVNYNYEQKLASQALQQHQSEMKKYVEQTSNVSQSVEYWKQRLDEVKVAISDQTAKLKDAEQTYWKTSEQAKYQREELTKLEKEYRELNRTLKDAKQNQWFFADSLDIVTDKIKQNLALTVGKKIISTAISTIKDAVDMTIEYGMEMNGVSLQFEQMATRWGMAYTELRDSLKEASKGRVSDIDIMQSANRGMALWVIKDVEQASDLMKIAQVRGAQMWETAQKAFDDMMTWIGRNSVMILDNLWIVINSKEAYERYAESIGKTTDQLTKQEKQQAMVNEVIRKSQAELKAREDLPLTVSQKFERMETNAKNAFAAIWDAFLKRIEPMVDLLWKVSTKISDGLISLVDEFNQSTWNIWVAVSWTLETIWSTFETTRTYISDAISTLVDIVKSVITPVQNLIKWALERASEMIWKWFNWFDEDSSSVAYDFRQVFAIAFSSIWRGFQTIWLAAKQFMDILKWWTSRIVGWGQAIWWWLKWVWNAMQEWQSDLVGAFNKWFGTAEVVEDTMPTLEQLWAEWWDLWAKIDDQLNNLDKKLADSYTKENSVLWDWLNNLKDLWDELDDTTSWWGSKKKTWKSEAEKDMENRVKQMKKDLEDLRKFDAENYKSLDDLWKQWLTNQAKYIDDLNKEYEDKFKEIQKNIDDTTKKIENLEKEIAKLQQALADLKTEETKSIANEVVKAKNELKSLEEQYKWLKEVAESVTLWDLEWKSWVGKFDVDLIKKYKEYQEEINWMYSWMSTEEQKALDKEIEYAEWYNNLNGVEKIKEDYRIRREEIQNELNEKLSSLASEQAELRKYKKEQNELQKERIKKIEEEEAKYKKMYDALVEFEKNYMNKWNDNHNQMMKSLNDLEQKRIAVARAKERAMNAWWGNYYARAIWWPVRENQPYLVWETGPELFIPNTAWRIVNNKDLNKGWENPISININMWWVVLNNWLDEEELLDRMESRLTRTLQLYKKWITL